MTNKTQDELIIEGAPNWANGYKTHEAYPNSPCYIERTSLTRSLSDIKELVELRRENAILKTIIEKVEDVFAINYTTFDRNDIHKSMNSLMAYHAQLVLDPQVSSEAQIFALEQQAKGLEDYAKEQESGLNAVWMLAKSTRLREQANKLKGQE